MSAAAVSPVVSTDSRTGGLRWALADAWTVTVRNLTFLRHEPGLLALGLAAPVGFLVAFSLLFGDAIAVPGGGSYHAFLLPGILAMSAFLGLVATAGATAVDAGLGVVDRLRTMPTSRMAVPVGQATADLVTGTVAMLVSAAVGYGLGWRPHGGALDLLAAFGLLVLFRYAITFAGVWLGLALGSEAAVQQVAPLVVGVTMFSNAFVPTANMPVVLRTITEWNPVSAVTAACRHLTGAPGVASSGSPWPLTHPVEATLLWSALLLLLFAPLAVRRYARSR